jgi:hypothetical protein
MRRAAAGRRGAADRDVRFLAVAAVCAFDLLLAFVVM